MSSIQNRFPHIFHCFRSHRAGVLSVLEIPDKGPQLKKSTVANAILLWDSKEFEHECATRGLCVTALRSYAEWEKEDQKKILEGVPPVVVGKVGDAPKRASTASKKEQHSRPLDGMRVLDLSRVLAGPIAGKTLAGLFSFLYRTIHPFILLLCIAHGADVLLLTSPFLPSLPFIDVETSLGKRTTQLDLTEDPDVNKLQGLVKDTDVFLQAYRPGGLKEKGFGVQDVVDLRPGIVYAELSTWGWGGPWATRKGVSCLFVFDQLSLVD